MPDDRSPEPELSTDCFSAPGERLESWLDRGMDSYRRALEVLRLHDGVLSLRGNARSTINTLLAAEAIVRVFPGVFVDAELVCHRLTRYAAALAVRPASVLWGESAVAAITSDQTPFDPREQIRLAQAEGGRSLPGVTIYRRRVTTIRRFNGLRCPPPALVAAEIAPRDDGRAAELFLREGLVSPGDLMDALAEFGNTREQRARRRIVVSYADNPWSGGERDLQAVLRGAGVTGWVANAALRVGGFTQYPDLLFEAARLIVEFDGFAVHGTRQAFESDRIRQNRLVLAGYRVLRYTWQRLQDDPDGIVAEIRAALIGAEPQVC